MARIVGGFCSSHAPTLNSPPERWGAGRNELERIVAGGMTVTVDIPTLVREREGWIDKELTLETKQERSERAHSAIRALADTIEKNRADVAIIIGDDTHEVFEPDEHIPAVDIYWGEEIVHIPHESRVRGDPTIDPTPKLLRGAPELAGHLVESLNEQGFEVSYSKKFPEGRVIGHAFDFIYGRVLRDHVMPHVPILLNTYYPPSAPKLTRCYAIGRALRRAVEAWDSDKTVAFIGTGGLSHPVVDETQDHELIEVFRNKDEKRLASFDDDDFRWGTSEDRNWLVVAGAMHDSDEQFSLIDYVPCYRSKAGTGCGVAFGYWL